MAKNIEIIDFFAPWCGPCRVMDPIFEELIKEYQDKVKFTKFNVDENQEIANKYNVMSIPTYLILKDDQVINQLSGIQTKAALKKIIDDSLEN